MPAATPDVLPLADGSGAPQPPDKHAVWRAPVAPGFDDWIWFDDTSKDQVSGYALAAAWLWDALHDDPEAPADVSEAQATDLAACAHALMKVAPEKGTDLCLRDADGRLTRFFDLNPRQLSPEGDALPEDSVLRNGFNALLALGIVRAAYHVTGDPEIGAFYYEELVGRRAMAVDPTTTVSVMYLGGPTNYSNVNMAAIGLASLGRFESDPGVRAELATTLTTQFWSTGSDRDASHVEQAWFDVVYGAYAADAPATIGERVRENLGGFPPAPCFERDRINCDDAELAAGSCIAIDGTTVLEILSDPGHNGQPVARDFLPMSIRPDSDFVWRSDPHSVNGTGSSLMAPRGDWLAAYWLGRISELADPDANLSPFARPPLPYGEGTGGAGGASPTPAAGGRAGDDGGCGCRAAGADGDGGEGALPAATAVLMALAVGRRRRR